MYFFVLLGSAHVKPAQKILMKLTLEVNFNNLLAQNANAPAVIVLRQQSLFCANSHYFAPFSFTNKTTPNLTSTLN